MENELLTDPLVILGLDAAWTSGEPSGVALVVHKGGEWKCLCVAPSYDAFVKCASGEQVDWLQGNSTGTTPDIAALIETAQSLAGAKAAVVAIDMPMSRRAFSGRRAADQAISAAFGARGCSTHSPSADRPGRLGATLTSDLSDAGYQLATTEDQVGAVPRAIEVYPHPALLVLLARSYRVPYKVSKSAKYWPGTTIQERVAKLIGQFTSIEDALRRVFGETHIPLPKPSEVANLSQLKRYEDTLDALVSAWVGMQYVAGFASAYGDAAASIWVPSSSSAV